MTTSYPRPKTVAEAIDDLGLQSEFQDWLAHTSDRFGFVMDVVTPELSWPPEAETDAFTDEQADKLSEARAAVAWTIGRFAWAGVRAALLAAGNTYLEAMRPKESTTTTPFADEIVRFIAQSSVECDKLIDDLAPELRIEGAGDLKLTEVNRRLDEQRELTWAIADAARPGIQAAINGAIMARMLETEGGRGD